MNDTSETNNQHTIEPEVVTETALVPSNRPALPITVEELANLPDNMGLENIQNRIKIVESLRRASVALTSPQDWLLFRTPEGAATGYLQDSGCKRIWQIWGIEIQPTGEAERIDDEKTGTFAYKVTGNGLCRATGLFVEGVEGIRYSTEDFCKNLPELQKMVRVKQAAIANRDGNIIRSLAGMKSVAVEILQSVWDGSGKTIDKCSHGKGYGSKHERAGVDTQSTDAPSTDAPRCNCGAIMQFVRGGERDGRAWAAYYKCPEYKWDYTKKQGNGHGRIDLSEHEAQMKAAIAVSRGE